MIKYIVLNNKPTVSFQRVHLEKAKKSLVTEAKAIRIRFELILSEIQHRSRIVLVRLDWKY